MKTISSMPGTIPILFLTTHLCVHAYTRKKLANWEEIHHRVNGGYL